MPTYQYECGSCGHSFDKYQMISEKKLKTCPECRKDALHRLIGTGSGIIFKGSGFYETDYKRQSPAKPQKPPCSESCGCPAASKSGEK